jgi:hypothetical protein
MPFRTITLDIPDEVAAYVEDSLDAVPTEKDYQRFLIADESVRDIDLFSKMRGAILAGVLTDALHDPAHPRHEWAVNIDHALAQSDENSAYVEGTLLSDIREGLNSHDKYIPKPF